MLLDMVYKGLTREKGVAPGGGLRLFYAYHTIKFSSRNVEALSPLAYPFLRSLPRILFWPIPSFLMFSVFYLLTRDLFYGIIYLLST